MKYVLQSDIKEIVGNTEIVHQQFNDRNILITGAGGFLGRYFLEYFQSLIDSKNIKMNIVAVDNFIVSASKSISEFQSNSIQTVIGSIEQVADLDVKFDFILHMAGIASPQHYKAKPLETIDVAVNSTRELLERAKKDGSKFLFFSSSEIYGDPVPEFVPTPETYRGNVTTRGPRACYDESKRLGETLCYVYQNYYHVDAKVVRPFNVYGPGMMPTDYRVLPNFAFSIMNKTPIQIYGNGEQTRTFCYVTDAISAFVLILVSNKGADVFNVGNPTPEISMNRLVEEIEKILERKCDLVHTPYPEEYPPDEPMRRCPDITKMIKYTEFHPKVDLNEGLTRFLNWSKAEYPQLI
jgi:UDP-glucuronate decarboxylase